MNKYKKISVSTLASIAILGTTVFATTGKVYNTSQGLVLRGSASKSGEPLATVAEGAEVEILENNGEWYKVQTNGKEGYLFAEYVKVEEQVAPEDNVEDNTENNENSNAVKSETPIHILPLITSSTIGTVPADGQVSVQKTVGKWNYISYDNVKGWIRNTNSEIQTTQEEAKLENEQEEPNQEQEKQVEEEQTEQENKTPEVNETTPAENTNLSFTKGYINSSSVNVRKEPSKSAEIVTTLILNTGVTITAQTDEWYKIKYDSYTGYIFKQLISENPVVTSRNAEARARLIEEEEAEIAANKQEETQNEPVAVASTSSSAAGENIVSFAKQYLGYPYVYGGTTPSGGFDCSGFVYYVFNSCGYSISRSCTVQAQSGTAVSRSELQPGDILFFNNTSNGAIGHTGIYIGNGTFIHAANPRRGVVTDTINSGYYNTYYYSARRVAN